MKVNTNINLSEDLTTTFKAKLAAAAKDHTIHEVTDIHDLEAMLNKVWKANVRQLRTIDPANVEQQYQPSNILIIGDAGTGKSSIVSKWMAKKEEQGKHIQPVTFNGSQLNPDLVQGVGHAVHKKDEETGEDMDYADYLNFKVFDKLQPGSDEMYGSILFIDELNRSYADARAALLDMITSHNIADNNAPGNRKHLDKWIMTVAAINPPDSAHRGTELLDLAMLTRFYIFEWKSSIKNVRKYLIKSLTLNLEQAKKNLEAGVDPNGRPYSEDDYAEDSQVFEGQINLAKKLLTPDIAFDSGETLKTHMKLQKGVINARTLENLIRLSDGTAKDLLQLLPGECGVDVDSPIYTKIKLALMDSATDTDDSFKKATTTAYDKVIEFEDEL